MSDDIALAVEVNVQDYFFDNASLDNASLNNASLDNAETRDQARGAEGRDTNHAAVPIPLETWESWFRTWLETLRPDLPGNAYELSLRLTDDAEIQSFNAQYRQKDQPTDVLAFAALEVDAPLPEALQSEMSLYLGDIVISVETAQSQARQQGHSLHQELAWLAAHALLHLLGWDHPDEASLLEMLHQQETLLQTIGLTSGYYQGELTRTDGAGVEMGNIPT
jgi:probable rRNA maturation factor